MTWVPGTAGAGARVWFLALVALAVGLSFVAKAYYQRQFGNVRPAINATAALAASVFVGLLIVAGSLQGDTLVSVPALFAALGLFGVPFHTRNVLCDLLIAVGFVTIGAGDHLLLRRTLAPVSDVEAV